MRRATMIVFVTSMAWAISAMAQEPGLDGRDDVLLQTSFESDDWHTAWGRNEAPRNASIVRDGSAFRGDGHLRVEVPADSHYGTSFGFQFEDQGLDEPELMYFRYAIRLGPDWTTEGGGGGKFPGFGGTYDTAGWGGRPADGTNGWSARMLFWQPESGRADGDTRIGYYAYHADMQGTYGDNWFWSGGPIGDGGALEIDRWYEIETHVQLNTPGENDGILRGWVDGTLVFDRSDVRFRDVEDLKIERVWFDLYYGGNWTAPHDMYVDFDNAVIAREPIGPVQDETPDPDGDTGSTPGEDMANSGDDGDMGSTPGLPDAGEPMLPGSDAGDPVGGDANDGSGDDGPASDTASDGGCCATLPQRPAGSGALVALAGLLLWVRRR